MQTIDRFKGKYRFLSNAYPVELDYEGLAYSTVDAAFHASKTKDPEIRRRFAHMAHAEAVKEGSKLAPYPGWSDRKIDIMADLVRRKFHLDPELKAKLLATGDAQILSDGDNGLWDHCDGHGCNELGRILMMVRGELPFSDKTPA